MIDDRSAGVLATLLPPAQAKAQAFLETANTSGLLPAGWTVKAISGTRSYAEQTALYSQGRSKPGRIVTNAPAGYSLHNFGIAFDIGIFDDIDVHIDKYIDDEFKDTDAYYARLAPVGRNLGLEWGGDWTSIKDFPHYQFNPAHLTLSQMRNRVASGVSLFS